MPIEVQREMTLYLKAVNIDRYLAKMKQICFDTRQAIRWGYASH